MEQAQRHTDFAETYERTVVPAIFEPYARDLVERARPIGPADRILDLGCGTGIVARVLRDRLGGAATITGLDKSSGMLAIARRLAPEIEWREGNAASLPFADGSFDLVVCQEMLQFVPDAAAAVREIHRVLAPQGRIVASTWRARHEQPLHDELGIVAERHLGVAHDLRWRLGDAEALQALFVDAGFSDVVVVVTSLVEKFVAFPTRTNALAANFDLAGLSEVEREAKLAAVERDSAPILERFGFAAASRANVVTARRA